MRVTVTGGTGTLGLASAEMAVRAGHQVRVFVRAAERFQRLSSERRIEVVEGDIRDRGSVAEALEDADAVVHCVDVPASEFADNWDGVRHALESLRAGGGFVMPGNLWVYGPPQSERVGPEHPKATSSRLGAVRADLEKAVAAEGGTIVHLPPVYGAGVRAGRMRRLFERALAGKTVAYPGNLDRPVEFLYLADAARALIAPLGRKAARGVDYTAPGYRITTPRQFITHIFRAVARAPRIRSLPVWLLGLVDLLRPERRPLRDLLYLERCATLLDGSRMRADLGWSAEVDYRDGIRRTVKWLRAAHGAEPPSDTS